MSIKRSRTALCTRVWTWWNIEYWFGLPIISKRTTIYSRFRQGRYLQFSGLIYICATNSEPLILVGGNFGDSSLLGPLCLSLQCTCGYGYGGPPYNEYTIYNVSKFHRAWKAKTRFPRKSISSTEDCALLGLLHRNAGILGSKFGSIGMMMAREEIPRYVGSCCKNGQLMQECWVLNTITTLGPNIFLHPSIPLLFLICFIIVYLYLI